MKGVHIKTHKFPTESKNVIVSFFTTLFLIVIVILFIPIILLAIIYYFFKGHLSKTDSIDENNTEWANLKTNSQLTLKTKYVNVDDVPDFIYDYFDPNPMSIYKSSPPIRELDGYFTEFKVERSDGIFLQKVETDTERKEVISAHLIFLNYKTLEIEYIMDLLGFEIMTKGKPNDFILTAFDDEQEHEIHLVQY